MSASERVLSHLLDCGMEEKLVTEARRFLAADVEDQSAHFYLALVLSDQKDFRTAFRHVKHLLAVAPESVRAHVAAIHYYSKSDNWKMVSRHVNEGLAINSERAYFHEYASRASLSRFEIKDAKSHIARARELDPDDADVANLYIHIHGSLEPTVRESLEKLEQFKAALVLDPANAALHHSIGGVYLTELDDPKAAEGHFVEALRTKPGERSYQRSLFDAVAKQSLIYRLFSIPTRSFETVGNVLAGLRLQPWRVIFLIVGMKFVGIYFLWLFLATVIFWPGGKVYEWLLVSQIRSGSGVSSGGLKLWFWIRKWPVWSRFLAFLGVNLLLWAGFFLWFGMSLEVGVGFLTVFIAVSFIWIALGRFFRRNAAKRERQRMVKKGSMQSRA